MSGRFITVDECAVLQELETRGPTRQLSARISGRLSLYGMIDEGPRGWVITTEGRKMLKSGRVAPRTPQDLILSMRPILATVENMAWVDEPAELEVA